MKNVFFALVALVLAPSVALAGGGSKSNATVNVKLNGSLQTGQVVGVIVDPPSTLDPSTATQAQFTAAGGKFLTGASANETVSFKNLKAGTHTIVFFAATNDGTTTNVGSLATRTVTVAKGQTLNYTVSADEANTVTVAP
jgi:hypothetical protein